VFEVFILKTEQIAREVALRGIGASPKNRWPQRAPIPHLRRISGICALCG